MVKYLSSSIYINILIISKAKMGIILERHHTQELAQTCYGHTKEEGHKSTRIMDLKGNIHQDYRATLVAEGKTLRNTII